MNDTNVRRAFSQLSRAWYGEANLKNADFEDEIFFGLYSTDGGTIGEISVRWVNLNGELTPKITVFSDAWNVLAQFKDLIDLLGKHDNENPTPKEFCKYLIGCGFVDITETERN